MISRSVLLLICAVSATGCGDSPAEPTDGPRPLPVALDISNEDGEIGGSFFDSAKDHFMIGEGGPQQPNALIYEITVTNNLGTPAHEVIVTSELAPHSGILGCGELLAQDPAGGSNPNIGSVIIGDDCSSPGLFWGIGTLGAGESASLYFRAEALDDGDDVNRVSVTAEGLDSAILIEEPTLVGGSGPALSLGVADGHIVGGVFSSAIELHVVGAGSSADPDALIYQIVVTNQSAVSATGVEILARIPRTGAGLACAAIREGDPAGGANPNIGSASCSIDGGLGWLIGELGPGESAVLYARVEALSPGNHLSRVTLSADALSAEVRRDELTPVIPTSSL